MSSLLLLLLLAVAPAAELTPVDVATLALDRDPSLAASATDFERARLLVLGEEHRYGLGLEVTGGARVRQGFGGDDGLSVQYSGGATLDRDFAVGTDVSLYVGASRGGTTAAALGQGTTSTGIGGSGQGFATIGGADSTTGVARVGVTQQLGAGRGLEVGWAARDQARASLSLEHARWRDEASGIVRDALTAYWELVYAEWAVRIDGAAFETAMREEEEASARVRSGSLAPVELLAYSSRTASLLETLSEARADAERRAVDLQHRLGLGERPIVGTVDVPDPAVAAGDVVARAVAGAPSVLEEQASLALAQVQARTAADSLEPSVALQAWVQGETVLDGSTISGPTQALTGYLGLTGSLDLDRTRYRTEVGRARLSVQAAQQRLDAAVRAVTIEAEQSITTVTSARERLSLATRTVEIAHGQAYAERARLAVGAGIALEVREAEDAVRDAELRLLRARVDLAEAFVTQAHLTGDLVGVEIEAAAPIHD